MFARKTGEHLFHWFSITSRQRICRQLKIAVASVAAAVRADEAAFQLASCECSYWFGGRCSVERIRGTIEKTEAGRTRGCLFRHHVADPIALASPVVENGRQPSGRFAIGIDLSTK